LVLFSFSFWNEFPLWKTGGSRYESIPRLGKRLKETFERDQHGKLDICSDDVLRGLDYKVYGHFLPTVFKPGNDGEIC
jgi:hypothetical protein